MNMRGDQPVRAKDSIFSRLRNLASNQRELILYCFIGCTGVAIDYLGFLILTNWTTLHYQVANAISVSLGILNNFFWNAHANFKVRSRLLLRFLSFYSVGLLGLGISATLLYLFVECWRWNIVLSKCLAIFFVTMVQFTLNKFITFRKGDNDGKASHCHSGL